MTKSTIWRRLGLFAATSSLLFASGTALTAAPKDDPTLRKHATTKADYLAQQTRDIKVGAESYGPFLPTVIDVDLRTLPAPKAWQPGDPIKHIPKRITHQPSITETPAAPKRDPLLDKQLNAVRGGSGITPGLNFAGQGFSGVYPPDMVGDIGANYYIQAINGSSGSLYTIYNKTTGSVAAGPFNFETLGSGNCGSGAGDPIVQYDALASRWVFLEFSASTNALCVYVSQTGDPITGGFFGYQFNTPNFPDYPKISVWSDAYYVSANESSPSAYALERSQMLAGLAATAQRMTAPGLFGFGFQALTPADHDGVTPPPVGAPGVFMRHRDDEVHNPGANNPTVDFLEVWEFDVDFATPANSTFTGPTNIPIAEIDSDLCGLFSFTCFQQPNGLRLDPLREVIMHRLAYRVIGGTQKLVGNLVTDVTGADRGGIRWFELSNTGGGWSLAQEGTYAPDTTNRWMGSIAMDQSGNIALGYSATSFTVSAGIRYTGRNFGDAAGTMTAGETTVIASSGSQNGERWGDYSAMGIDPVDGCTFWYTNEYVIANGSWNTRITSFSFDSCGLPTGECGDSILDAGEQCDDGNTGNGDGCSDSCQVEAGWECTLPIPGGIPGNSVADGSFEAGTPNPSWTEASTTFGTPLCDIASCGTGTGTGPSDGDWWAWFGGIAGSEAGSVEQSVTIPVGSNALTFDLEAIICDSAADFMRVRIDGNLEFEFLGDDAICGNLGYSPQSVDITAYADGNAHTVRFESEIFAVNLAGSNIFVDNVYIDNGQSSDPIPSMCTLIPIIETCYAEDFDPPLGGDFGPIGWTVFNVGPLAVDWGTTDDTVCASDGVVAGNHTGSTGEAACIDSDANPGGDIDAYLCSDGIDLSTVVGADLEFAYNYQVFQAPTAGDFFEVLVGSDAPSSGTIGGYDTVFSTAANAGAFNAAPGVFQNVDLSAYDGNANVHVCYRYGGNFDWYAQVDDVAIVADDCDAVVVVDTDGDGVTDDVDNCVFTPNAPPMDCDTDNDGFGNRCDADIDIDPIFPIVNFFDLQGFGVAFQAQLMGTYTPEADLDCSGFVNFGDLSIFKLRFGAAPGDPDAVLP